MSFQITMMKLLDRMLALGPGRERRPPARQTGTASGGESRTDDYQTKQKG